MDMADIPQYTPETLPLRDYHLPDPIGWWPLAPGWWITFCLVCLILLVVFLWRRWQYQRQPRQEALAALEKIQQHHQQSGDNLHVLRALSTLLRRIAISTTNEESVASLNGEDWLVWLDQFHQGKPFQQGVGRIITTGPYQPQILISDRDIQQLQDLVQKHIKNIRSWSC